MRIHADADPQHWIKTKSGNAHIQGHNKNLGNN
jgi:hypothetical protein